MEVKNKNGFLAFLKKFVHHKAALAALIIFLLEVLCILILPVVLDLDPNTSDYLAMAKGPSAAHILGTDEIGRDLFARILYGGRVSMFVGICATLMSVSIGVPLGVIAGYYQGKVGAVIMRICEMFMAFPSMILTLVLITVLEPSAGTVIFAIGIMGWTRHCKLLYGSVMAARSKEYVEAAIAIGTSSPKIIAKYILPNAISPLWVSLAFSISNAIISESSLSFLGAGIKAPQASWGNIIYAAQKLDVLTSKPWMWVPAALVLLVTVVSINLVGEGIRDAFDPKMRR